MAYFSAIKLNEQKIQSIGSYAVRNEGSIYIEVYWEKLEKEFMRYKRNYEELGEVAFYHEDTKEEDVHKGPYSIQMVNQGLIQLKKI
ncbi:hypothetical protein [Thalassobacillus pellis]|uniref:hypothetical protein n=1 Tax=Thalassobacillus pellis TaxID=748008 RepID=UPI00195FEA1A|nr:hypothetical protein [Thalassobacillus pellis]MBM7551864.1 hypothetical protein [Thalassobacillus pellis]